MKLLNIVVLLSCVILNHGEELTDECRNEMLTKAYEADLCIESAGPPQQLMSEFNQTVFQLSDNEVNFQKVEDIFTKICLILPQYYECTLLVFDISDECHLDSKATLRKLILDESAAVSEYACENNSEMVKKLIPHNGLQFFFFNDDFYKCAAIVKELDNLDELCSAIDRAYQCAADVTDDQPNKHIMVVAREIALQFKQTAKC